MRKLLIKLIEFYQKAYFTMARDVGEYIVNIILHVLNIQDKLYEKYGTFKGGTF